MLKPNGVGKAYIGTKRYYFGAQLGGGTASWTAFLKQRQRTREAQGVKQHLKVEVVTSIEDGHSMVRDVLLVTLV